MRHTEEWINKIQVYYVQSSDIIKEPVGLITADEVAFTGGIFGTNKSYYLYNNQYYWTMSPSVYSDVDQKAYIFIILSTGDLYTDPIDTARSIRPVINLKVDIQFTGSGTVSDPYQVVGT